MEKMGDCDALPTRERKQLAVYLHDMDRVFCEMERVLKPGGRIILVVGDSTRRGVFLKNSVALTALGEHHNLKVLPSYERVIPPNRRYLPAPSHSSAGAEFQARMRSEVVLTFTKKQ
jgi:ubiquinone/menaquinone biosynthesis C-methylase UbiE